MTAFAAPLTSKYLTQDPVLKIRNFYCFIWIILFSFWILFLVTGSSTTQDTHQSLKTIEMVLYCGFYLWVGVQNVLCISTLWARCADVFPSDAAKRLFGFISAGSTLGQLLGSLLAKTQIQWISKNAQIPPFHLVLSAGVLMIFASVLIKYIQKPVNEVKEILQKGVSNGSYWDGFELILRSRYLLVICLYFILNYAMASQFYFQKSVIVAKTLESSSKRTSWFAQLNLYSGSITFLLQLTLTGLLNSLYGLHSILGTLLTWCDFRVALLITPCLCTVGMSMVTLMPTPMIIGMVLVSRPY